MTDITPEEIDKALSPKEQTVSAKDMLNSLGITLDTTRAAFLTQKTPTKEVYKRPGKGGGQWSYVKGKYVRKVLNVVFSWLWDFELLPCGPNGALHLITKDQVMVVGRLTIKNKNGDPIITKTGTGKKDIALKKDGNQLDLGNDMKAAETDSLKRCAANLGIGLDLDGGDEDDPITQVDSVAERIETATKNYREGQVGSI